MSATIDSKFSKSLVIGGSGLVGGYILQHLVRVGERPLALSRSRRISPNVDWFRGDLEAPEELKFPQFSVLFCTASAILFSSALPYLLNPQLKRAVVFTSTSVLTKLDSEVIAEREMIQNLAASEQKIIATCEKSNIAWTILRPTLIYDPGRDANITPLSRLIERFGFMPLVGAASGLRQPVHAEDLAIGAIASASSSSAENRIYSLSGGETITYREMIGRIFDGLKMPRRSISIPEPVWKAAFAFAKPLFPGTNVAMGTRMMKHMVFDSTPAAQDFDWNPRRFNPVFDRIAPKAN